MAGGMPDYLKMTFRAKCLAPAIYDSHFPAQSWILRARTSPDAPNPQVPATLSRRRLRPTRCDLLWCGCDWKCGDWMAVIDNHYRDPGLRQAGTSSPSCRPRRASHCRLRTSSLVSGCGAAAVWASLLPVMPLVWCSQPGCQTSLGTTGVSAHLVQPSECARAVIRPPAGLFTGCSPVNLRRRISRPLCRRQPRWLDRT